jgi:hypothetical protein
MADELVKVTPEMQEAWVKWEGFDVDPPLTVRQSALVRHAFMSGWIACRVLAREAALASYRQGSQDATGRMLNKPGDGDMGG